jgi:hypothetical protein
MELELECNLHPTSSPDVMSSPSMIGGEVVAAMDVDDDPSAESKTQQPPGASREFDPDFFESPTSSEDSMDELEFFEDDIELEMGEVKWASFTDRQVSDRLRRYLPPNVSPTAPPRMERCLRIGHPISVCVCNYKCKFCKQMFPCICVPAYRSPIGRRERYMRAVIGVARRAVYPIQIEGDKVERAFLEAYRIRTSSEDGDLDDALKFFRRIVTHWDYSTASLPRVAEVNFINRYESEDPDDPRIKFSTSEQIPPTVYTPMGTLGRRIADVLRDLKRMRAWYVMKYIHPHSKILEIDNLICDYCDFPIYARHGVNSFWHGFFVLFLLNAVPRNQNYIITNAMDIIRAERFSSLIYDIWRIHTFEDALSFFYLEIGKTGLVKHLTIIDGHEEGMSHHSLIRKFL